MCKTMSHQNRTFVVVAFLRAQRSFLQVLCHNILLHNNFLSHLWSFWDMLRLHVRLQFALEGFAWHSCEVESCTPLTLRAPLPLLPFNALCSQILLENDFWSHLWSFWDICGLHFGLHCALRCLLGILAMQNRAPLSHFGLLHRSYCSTTHLCFLINVSIFVIPTALLGY